MSEHSVNGKKVADMLVKDLQAELKKRNASTTGRKADLYARLVALMDQDQAQPKAEEPKEGEVDGEGEAAETTTAADQSGDEAASKMEEEVPDSQEQRTTPDQAEAQPEAKESQPEEEEETTEQSEEAKPQTNEAPQAEAMEEEREQRKRKVEELASDAAEEAEEEEESKSEEPAREETTAAAAAAAEGEDANGEGSAAKRQKRDDGAEAQQRGRRLFGNALPTREPRDNDKSERYIGASHDDTSLGHQLTASCSWSHAGTKRRSASVATTGRGCESARDSASPRGLSLPRRTLAGLLPCRAVPRSQTSSKTSPGLRPLIVLSLSTSRALLYACVSHVSLCMCLQLCLLLPASRPTRCWYAILCVLSP